VGGVVKLLSEARNSNCEPLGDSDQMPTSVTGESASPREVICPFTATIDVPLHAVAKPPLEAAICPPRTPQKQPPLLKHPPPNRSAVV